MEGNFYDCTLYCNNHRFFSWEFEKWSVLESFAFPEVASRDESWEHAGLFILITVVVTAVVNLKPSRFFSYALSLEKDLDHPAENKWQIPTD